MNREQLLKELRKHWKENNIPNISDTNAHFLQDLITLSKSKSVLEIGTANWFSTIHLGISAEKYWWKVIGIDFSSRAIERAQENIQKAKLNKTVKLIHWNALDVIPNIDEEFDFVFIDGMMKSSIKFVLSVWNKVKIWWIIIIDDVIKFKEKMNGLEDFLDKNGIVYNILPIDIDDGIMMIIKQDIELNTKHL